MDDYNIEELYYLYRQGSPVAGALLIKYCYWQVELMLPAYYFYNENYRNEREDCIQDVVIRCVKNLDSYRPDKGMLVKSYLSLIIKRTISSILVSRKRKTIKEKIICFSLNSYCSEDCKISYLDVVKDSCVEYQPDVQMLQQERRKDIEKYILEKCSFFEQSIIKGHECGYKDIELAKILELDVKKVYNANYRIQKKMSKLKLID